MAYRTSIIAVLLPLVAVLQLLVPSTAASSLVAPASHHHRQLETTTSSTSGGCKTQNLKPCGKQDWCHDEASGEWVKSGDVYDVDACASTEDEWAGSGTWETKTLTFDGLERSYLMYTPKGIDSYAGLMLFLHGAGGSSNVHNWYDVAAHADKYGFVGLIPNGSPFDTNKDTEKDMVKDSGTAAANNEGECEYYLYQGECWEVCPSGKKKLDGLDMCEGLTEWGTGSGKDEASEVAPVPECDEFELYLHTGRCYFYCLDDKSKVIVDPSTCAGMTDMTSEEYAAEKEKVVPVPECDEFELYLHTGRCYFYCLDDKSKVIVDPSTCAGMTDMTSEEYAAEKEKVVEVPECEEFELYLYGGKCYYYCLDDKSKVIVDASTCDGMTDMLAGGDAAKETEGTAIGSCDYYLYTGECWEVCGTNKGVVNGAMCKGKTDLADTEPENVIGSCKYYLGKDGMCYEDCGTGNKLTVEKTKCDGEEAKFTDVVVDADEVSREDGCEYYLWSADCYEVCNDGKKPIVDVKLCEGKPDIAKERSGGKRKLVQGTYKWNLDDPEGVDEVSFLKHIVATESEAHSIGDDLPKIAMGFSNGAGMVVLLGCQEGGDLWIAHAAMPIDMSADFPSTCASVKGGSKKGGKMLLRRYLEATPPKKTSWYAVGENDFFINSLQPTPVQGLMEQYTNRHMKSDCPEEDWLEAPGKDFTCYHYPSCVEVGALCVYDDIGHTIKPSMTENAWMYLTTVATQSQAGESLSGTTISSSAVDALASVSSGGSKIYALSNAALLTLGVFGVYFF